MKKIRLGAILVAAAMLLSQAVAPVSAAEKIHDTTPTFDIYMDGNKLKLPIQPYIQKGTTMVPFRSVFEQLGLRVSWNKKTQQIVGKNEERSIVLTVNSATALINGKAETMPLAPVIKNGVTYIPLRFAGTASGGKVELYQGGLNVVWVLSSLQNDLYEAVKAKDTDKVAQLLSKGADPEVLIGPVGPAIFTFADESTDIIGLFIKHGMGIDKRSADYAGYTLLHNAVKKGLPQVVEFLLKEGANPAIKSESGSTPLELAEFWREQVRFGYKDILEDAKAPTVQDFDTIISLLKDTQN
ncbi:stalk domain-containing protein [Paenibacillus sp. GCM10027626]|uniref:stalk domain-containing protein n=1 Tax=Paenibacillus sp. GCM10027626 TaxID=3273411 RepID=UPI00363BA5BA